MCPPFDGCGGDRGPAGRPVRRQRQPRAEVFAQRRRARLQLAPASLARASARRIEAGGDPGLAQLNLPVAVQARPVDAQAQAKLAVADTVRDSRPAASNGAAAIAIRPARVTSDRRCIRLGRAPPRSRVETSGGARELAPVLVRFLVAEVLRAQR
jgi:hypothetical protein